VIAVEDIPHVWATYRGRYAERDARIDRIDDVLAGRWSVLDKDDTPITSRSPNLVQVALEDTAEAAAVVPNVRVVPWRDRPRAKAAAEVMEKAAVGYLEASHLPQLLLQSFMDLAAYGYFVWVVWPEGDGPDQMRPWIERRDPRACWPDPAHRVWDTPNLVLFGKQAWASSLPPAWQEALRATGWTYNHGWEQANTVTVVEVWEPDGITVAGLWQQSVGPDGQPNWVPVLFERIPNELGINPVVIGARITHDGEFRGQFDQVVGLMEAHIRLMGILLDYADQAVYSDIWVKDPIGEITWGGGGWIELGPQGAIGRVPPAVSSMQVDRELEALVEAMHVGARWPRSRPGDIEQNIASAKFLEATAGMMNTVIRTYHLIMSNVLERAVRLCLLSDHVYHSGHTKTVWGVMRNQEFCLEYDPADFDLRNNVRVEYGLGMGRDPAQSAVLMLQYASQRYISREYVQENIPGLADVARERMRLDLEALEQLVTADLARRVQEGTLGLPQLFDIMERRRSGQPLVDAIREVVEAAPPPVPFPAPGAPPGIQPPSANSLLARLALPLPGGGVIGSQVVGRS
jgi:hypothetical protein